MSFLFWKKTKSINEMIENYMEAVDHCIKAFQEGIYYYLEHHHDKDYQKLACDAHKFESGADDIRREIEHKLYGEALLPESRGDILGMIESIDRIPSVAEDCLSMLDVEQPKIPKFMIEYLKELVEINVEAYFLIRKAVHYINKNPKETLYINKEIDVKESRSDDLEEKIAREIFASEELELSEKMQLKAIPVKIGDLSDRCQNSVDRMSLVAIKRRV
ncbi:MAG: DUF47 domain-containing protein [Myxococcota bacterium]